MGDEISVPCAQRGCTNALQRSDSAELRFDGHPDTKRGGKQRPHPPPLELSSVPKRERYDQASEGAKFEEIVTRISTSEEALLGRPFLGHRLWRLDGWQHH